jgi:hypothetical protein
MSKFHFLQRGDIIRENDEYKGWNPDCTKLIWIKITKKDYGNIIGTPRTNGMTAIRRRPWIKASLA